MGEAMTDYGFVVSSARILKRAWQIYVAHIFLFVIYMGQIAYVARGFQNPLYAEEMNILEFLQQPDVTLVQALLLKFKPVNMDVLPLYIVLMALLSAGAVAAAAQRHAGTGALGAALCADLGIRLEPAGLSERHLVLQSAGLAAAVRVRGMVRARRRRAAELAAAVPDHVGDRVRLSAIRILDRADLALFRGWRRLVPRWLAEHIYPIDKTNLDVLRFAHFLALAAIAVYFVPRDWPPLRSAWLRPAILCGQHSLEIFCLGVFMAFAAHFVKVEISPGIPMQIAVSVLGILIMVGVAWLLSWYKGATARKVTATRPVDRSAKPSLGGEA